MQYYIKIFDASILTILVPLNSLEALISDLTLFLDLRSEIRDQAWSLISISDLWSQPDLNLISVWSQSDLSMISVWSQILRCRLFSRHALNLTSFNFLEKSWYTCWKIGQKELQWIDHCKSFAKTTILQFRAASMRCYSDVRSANLETEW